MRGFGLQRQRPVADQLRIAAVLLRKIGRWMPQYAVYEIKDHRGVPLWSFKNNEKYSDSIYKTDIRNSNAFASFSFCMKKGDIVKVENGK